MDAAELFSKEIVKWSGDNPDDKVEDVDALLLAASDTYERSTTATPTSLAPAARRHHHQLSGSSVLRFALPQSAQDIHNGHEYTAFQSQHKSHEILLENMGGMEQTTTHTNKHSYPTLVNNANITAFVLADSFYP